MKLIEIFNEEEAVKEETIKNKEKEEFKIFCELVKEHWKKNNKEILEYFRQKRRGNGEVFIRFCDMKFSPFSDIPILKVYEKALVAMLSIVKYFEVLNIKVQTKTSNKLLENGILISLDSEVPNY